MTRYIVSLLLLPLSSVAAAAGFSDMGKRLPADTNAIVAINFDAVMQTPLAQKEDWPSRWTSLYEAGPLTIPPGSQRVLSGSHLLHDLESAKWQISLMQMQQEMPIQEIARSVGGTTEKLWNKTGVKSPSGVYFVGLDAKTIASIAGGDRQFTVNWVREEKASGPSSEFIKQVIAALGSSGHVVLALDVQDQYSAEEIRKGLELNPFKATGDKKADPAVLSQLLASIQSILTEIQIGEKPTAKVTLQFGMDVGLMEFYAKPLMTEIMSRNGFAMPEVKDWKVEVSGKQVTLEGEMARGSLRNVLGFITGPMPAYAEAKGGAASDDPAAVAKASQSYYRSISAILDGYSGQQDYSEAAGWLRKEAQRIDRLSIVNVDPDLATWGSKVATTMRESAAMLKGDQMSSVAGAQGVVQQTGTGNYWSNGDSYYEGYRRSAGQGVVENQNAARERARIVNERKADSIKKTAELMSGLVQDRAKLRVMLTEKYKVAF